MPKNDTGSGDPAQAGGPGRRLGRLVDVPPGWRVLEESGLGPFVTRASLERPDGTRVEWTSRRHRKRLGLRDAASAEVSAEVSAPQRRRARRPSAQSLWIGGLFMVGSFCFALGSLPLYFDNVAARTTAVTFFVGSVFFTSAAYLQYHETLGAARGLVAGAGPSPGRLARLVGWKPHRIDWWATAVQLVGTVFFNVSTFAATVSDLELEQQRRLVWAPDVLGSVCFLVASWLAYAEVCPRLWCWRDRSMGWWIGALNLLGSIAFGISAVAARYLLSTGEPANLELVNLGTFVGAVCFLLGAALLPVESAREATVVAAPARSVT